MFFFILILVIFFHRNCVGWISWWLREQRILENNQRVVVYSCILFCFSQFLVPRFLLNCLPECVPCYLYLFKFSYSYCQQLLDCCIMFTPLLFCYFHLFKTFSQQCQPMVLHRSLSDSKSPQVSRTLLSIPDDLKYAAFWMVSSRPLTSKSSILVSIVWWLYQKYELQLV